MTKGKSETRSKNSNPLDPLLKPYPLKNPFNLQLSRPVSPIPKIHKSPWSSSNPQVTQSKSSKSKSSKGRRKTRKKPKYGLGKHKVVYMEYKKGNSHKFWQGELSKKKDVYFVTYGKVGTKGRSMSKRVGQYSPKKAQEIFQALVESKLKKGYLFKDKVVN